MADLLPISDRLYDLSILLVFRFDDTYEHDVLLNHHIPVEEARRYGWFDAYPVWVLMTIDFIGFLCSRHFRVKHLNIPQITINSVIIAYLVMAIIE